MLFAPRRPSLSPTNFAWLQILTVTLAAFGGHGSKEKIQIPEQELNLFVQDNATACLEPLEPLGNVRRRAVSPIRVEFDRFGVRKIYPTAGREWFLPADADQKSLEWEPSTDTDRVMKIGEGVFEVRGQVRMTAKSPAGKAWWRNVEMTGYIRYLRYEKSADDLDPHWEWFARSERHTSIEVIDGNQYNDSVAAPPGTITPPGYDRYKEQPGLNAHCLGTAYHGNIYPPYSRKSSRARVLFEKEISHTGGYSDMRPCRLLRNFDPPETEWFGYKLVIRNFDADQKVRMEIWLDQKGNGDWTLQRSVDDAGDWWADPNRRWDGCDSSPFYFTKNQRMTWAAPWVTFRSDSVVWDFKWLSVREISPLP